jgi:hypothetical protein
MELVGNSEIVFKTRNPLVEERVSSGTDEA